MEFLITLAWKTALILLLVGLNGFFVAAEFAIVKVRATQIAQIETGQGRRAQKIVANLDAYLSATQLGITLASLGLGWIGEPTISWALTRLFRWVHIPEWLLHPLSFLLGFSVITFLHIVLGEMAPKSLAIRKAEKTTLWTAVPLDAFYRLFQPFIYILNQAANLVLKGLGIQALGETQQTHTEEEIRTLLTQSHKSGVIDQEEWRLFDNVFEFADRVAREVMVPRVNIDCVYADQTLEDNLSLIRESPHTRFPICGEDKDDILGIVHVRDVYEKVISGQEFSLIALARPAVIVPETMELSDMLRTLQKNKTGMSIVVDEYGGTSGLVTIEDIIEEIFGEIQDEFDEQQVPFFQQKGRGTSIDARLLIDDVNDYFQLQIEDVNNDTIGGWLFSQLEKVPQKGDQVVFQHCRFIVERMEQLQIKRILVIPLEIAEDHSHTTNESSP